MVDFDKLFFDSYMKSLKIDLYRSNCLKYVYLFPYEIKVIIFELFRKKLHQRFFVFKPSPQYLTLEEPGFEWRVYPVKKHYLI